MWTTLSENTLREFGEKTSVLRILHMRQSQDLSRWDKYLLVPSVLCSVTSAALSATLDESVTWAPYCAGGLALIGGIFTSIKQHLRYSERTENHKRAACSYGKIYRLVTTELSLSRQHRTRADELLKKVRHQLDSVSEDAPLIDRNIVNSFMETFDNSDNITLPEVCNGLKRIHVRIADSNEVMELTTNTSEYMEDTMLGEDTEPAQTLPC